ncbi:hypothetical protein D8X77_22125 [Vibrio vulnificus]|nr:hypothetical protein [Vibrio vulnificus]
MIHITRRLRQIRNAWHSQFKFSFVFTLQWIRFSGGVAHYLTRRYVSLQSHYILILRKLSPYL